MSPRKNKHQRAEAAAADFNKVAPSGTPVRFWPAAHQGEPLTSRTRGAAWAMPSGEAVVRVEGRTGGIALSHIEVILTPSQTDNAGGSKADLVLA